MARNESSLQGNQEPGSRHTNLAVTDMDDSFSDDASFSNMSFDSVQSYDLPQSSLPKKPLRAGLHMDRIVSGGIDEQSLGFSVTSSDGTRTPEDPPPVSLLEMNSLFESKAKESVSQTKRVDFKDVSPLRSRLRPSSANSAHGKDTKLKRNRLSQSRFLQWAHGGSSFMGLPTIDELVEEMGVTQEALEHSKRENYQRKFRLWMPMVHEYQDDANEDEEVEEVQLLPVDELLDRAMLRRVRIAAVNRSVLFLVFILLYCTMLVLQRDLADSYELESALKTQVETGDMKFSELEQINDVWNWMQTSLIDGVVPATEWYNGEPMEGADQGYSFFYNKQ